MTVKVDAKKCIGCGACAATAPKTFKLNAGGKAQVINPPGDSQSKVKEAADGCPVDAITLK